MKSPCYNCKNRKINCHSQCKTYKKYREKFKVDEGEREFRDYLYTAIRNMKGEGRWG